MDEVSRDDIELAGLNARLAKELEVYAEAEAQSNANPLLGQEEQIRTTLNENRREAYNQVMKSGLQGSDRAPGEDNFDFLVRTSGIHDAYNQESITVSDGQTKTASAAWFRATQTTDATRHLTSEARSSDVYNGTAGALFRANSAIEQTMEQRHAELHSKPGVKESEIRGSTLESELFMTRAENEDAHGQRVREAAAAGQPRPTRINAVTTPSAKLTDALMSKPMEDTRQAMSGELQHGNGQTINFAAPNAQAAMANKSVGQYAQALGKMEAITEIKDDVESKRSSVAQTQAEIAKRLQGRTKGDSSMPQFDPESAEHYSKLNPADPKDRATLLQASQIMSDQRSFTKGSAQAQLIAAARGHSTPETESSEEVLGSGKAERQGKAAGEARATTQSATGDKQASGQREQMSTGRATMSKTGRPVASPEEIQRRQRQFEFIESRALAGSSPEQTEKALRDFREQEQLRAQQTTQQQTTNQQVRKVSGRSMG